MATLLNCGLPCTMCNKGKCIGAANTIHFKCKTKPEGSHRCLGCDMMHG